MQLRDRPVTWHWVSTTQLDKATIGSQPATPGQGSPPVLCGSQEGDTSLPTVLIIGAVNQRTRGIVWELFQIHLRKGETFSRSSRTMTNTFYL